MKLWQGNMQVPDSLLLVSLASQQHLLATGDEKFKCDPDVAILAIDALGFRRSSGVLQDLLKKEGLEEEELFKQAKIRGIRALMGHAETTDVTNDGRHLD